MQSLLILALFSAHMAAVPPGVLPAGFVVLHNIDKTIVEDMRYAGSHNFTGRPVPGYDVARCVLTEPSARALAAVQTELLAFGMGLKVYDCYRPQRSVNAFIAWAKAPQDTKAREEFYPKVDKKDLFRDGYIAERSGHSRGSTVDLTVIPLPSPNEPAYRDGQPLVACTAPQNERFADNSLDFGTGYDCFDPLAHTANPDLAPLQRQRRLMLKALMEKHGFDNYANEWWHFTLRQEPHPTTYFDFTPGALQKRQVQD